MAIKEYQLRYFVADTEAEIPPNQVGPAIIRAADTGKYFLIHNGSQFRIFSDADAIGGSFLGVTDFVTTSKSNNSNTLSTQ